MRIWYFQRPSIPLSNVLSDLINRIIYIIGDFRRDETT